MPRSRPISGSAGSMASMARATRENRSATRGMNSPVRSLACAADPLPFIASLLRDPPAPPRRAFRLHAPRVGAPARALPVLPRRAPTRAARRTVPRSTPLRRGAFADVSTAGRAPHPLRGPASRPRLARPRGEGRGDSAGGAPASPRGAHGTSPAPGARAPRPRIGGSAHRLPRKVMRPLTVPRRAIADTSHAKTTASGSPGSRRSRGRLQGGWGRPGRGGYTCRPALKRPATASDPCCSRT